MNKSSNKLGVKRSIKRFFIIIIVFNYDDRVPIQNIYFFNWLSVNVFQVLTDYFIDCFLEVNQACVIVHWWESTIPIFLGMNCRRVPTTSWITYNSTTPVLPSLQKNCYIKLRWIKNVDHKVRLNSRYYQIFWFLSASRVRKLL